MWERCRPHREIGFITAKGDKEGQTTGWNKSGLNNKSKSISWLSNTLSLISSLLAPLFRRMRATFPQFNFLCLCFSPPSGKTFICFMLSILIFGELAPLFRRMRATFPQFNFFDLCFAPPSGKTFSHIDIIYIICRMLFLIILDWHMYIDCAVIYNSLKIFLGEIFHRSFKITWHASQAWV